MEPRGSIAEHDPRVEFVHLPDVRSLAIVDDPSAVPASAFIRGALVWIKPFGSEEETLRLGRALKDLGVAAVRILPREDEDAPLPAQAGSPAAVSGPSEVRPVVAELLNEVPEALRADATAFVERKLSEAGV